jgi:hypothetical protein
VHVEMRSVGFLVEPQNWQLWFCDLGLKISSTVSWFGPQNQAGFDLSIAQQNRRREVGVGQASRSSGLLSRGSKSSLKTGGGATTGGARGTIAEVESEAS